MKLILLVLIGVLIVAEAEAVIVGPYNVTVNLPEFKDIQLAGPLGGPEAGYVSYRLDIAKGNSTIPSEDVHVPELMVDITKYSLPIDIDNPARLEEVYDATASEVPPGWDRTYGDILIGGHSAASWENPTYNTTAFYCYFIDHNTLVRLGVFELSSRDFNQVLRTFHVLNA